MQKTIVITVVLGVVVGVLIGGSIYYIMGNKTDIRQSPSAIITKVPTPTEIPLIFYKNPAGFSFRYPESLTLEEKEDTHASYADILLTSSVKKGNMIFQVTDTTAVSARDWIEKEHISTSSAQVSTIPFADIQAVEIASKSGILTVSYDQGALFLININFQNNPAFWRKVYDVFISSFEFVEPEKESAPAPKNTGSLSSPGIIFEGEEIVE